MKMSKEIILELAAQTGAEVSVDRMGNVIARKPGLKTGKRSCWLPIWMR